MSLRKRFQESAATSYLPVYHPLVGHGSIRSLTEYQRSCLENAIASENQKKSGVTKNRWLLTARAKLLMFTLCESASLYEDPADPTKVTGPNPDANKPVYTTVLDMSSGSITFDKDELREMLTNNGAVTGAFAELAMRYIGMSSTDFEELLKNSELTDADGSL